VERAEEESKKKEKERDYMRHVYFFFTGKLPDRVL